MSGFRKFLLRGNIIDLAVAVVIGVAFAAVVAALVKDIITPIIGALGGLPDFSAWSFTINGSKFLIGDFINAVLAFVIVALIIYFSHHGGAPLAPLTKSGRRTYEKRPCCQTADSTGVVAFAPGPLCSGV